MIEIKCWTEAELLCIEMQGHAHNDVPGKDIVCAAASMLIYTLRQRQQELNAHPFECVMTDGYARLKVPAAMKESFETVVSGFKLLSEGYPANVVFTRD